MYCKNALKPLHRICHFISLYLSIYFKTVKHIFEMLWPYSHLKFLRSATQRLLEISWTQVQDSMDNSVCWPVSPPLWFRLKHLNNFWMDCHEIEKRHLCSPEQECYWLCRFPDFPSSATMRFHFWGFWVKYLNIGWNCMKFATPIMFLSGWIQTTLVCLFNLSNT